MMDHFPEDTLGRRMLGDYHNSPVDLKNENFYVIGIQMDPLTYFLEKFIELVQKYWGILRYPRYPSNALPACAIQN